VPVIGWVKMPNLSDSRQKRKMGQTEEDGMINFSPLIRRFTFNAWMVAGFTPITRGSKLDFYINRGNGMKGYVLNFTLRGAGRISSGNETFVCQPGDILLFPAGVPHLYGRQEESDCWDHLWIYFIPRTYWMEWLQWQQNVNRIGRLALQTPGEIDNMRQRFVEVLQLNVNEDPLAEALAMNAVERIILECFRAQPDLRRPRRDPRIEQLCQFILHNLAQEISVEQLAAKACLSPSRLAHLFKQETGDTLFAWREKQRVARASELLEKTSFTINPLYFSRIFRQHRGVSPREYRKKYA
jgi:AraC family transcriptional regulator of arabinose operon